MLHKEGDVLESMDEEIDVGFDSDAWRFAENLNCNLNDNSRERELP
jgi:hypothetical protein